MDIINCVGCGNALPERAARCLNCGEPTLIAPPPPAEGLNALSSAVVIVAVLSLVMLGVVAFVQRESFILIQQEAAARQQAADEAAGRDAAQRERDADSAAGPSPSPTPVVQQADGTHIVQAGESLFSVAAAYGLSANELVHWNADEYPTLRSTPALRAGWVLKLSGPPLPTPAPRPTLQPRPTRAPGSTRPPGQTQPSPSPAPDVAMPDLPRFGPASFPQSESVSVTFYTVTGATPREIGRSIQQNGPWSDWLGTNAQAHVQVTASYGFHFQPRHDGSCNVVITSGVPVTFNYSVHLPAWSPPTGASQQTVKWWIDTIHETVEHEAHHITLYEAVRPAMNDAVRTGTCASIPVALNELMDSARAANCRFDLQEYGYASGLSMESCLRN